MIKDNENAVVLIDYDDMEMLEDPIDSMEKMKKAFLNLKDILKQNRYLDEDNDFFQVFRGCLQAAFKERSKD